jgi:heat shock protein HslJ
VRNLVFAAALALGLAGCDETTENDLPILADWVAESINGKPVIEPGGVTLTLSQDRVTGRSGCNSYFANAEIRNGTLKVGPIGATKMACMRDGLMQQESEYLNTLGAAQNYSVQSDHRLTITTPQGGTLIFKAAPATPPPIG